MKRVIVQSIHRRQNSVTFQSVSQSVRPAQHKKVWELVTTQKIFTTFPVPVLNFSPSQNQVEYIVPSHVTGSVYFFCCLVSSAHIGPALAKTRMK